MSGILSLALKMERMTLRSRNGRFANRSRVCRPSLRYEVARIFSSPALRRFGTSAHSEMGTTKPVRESQERTSRMSESKLAPRTYNQIRIPRKYTAGKRRFTIYWTWSYPWEANRDVAELDNRFSTMTEVRRVGWPDYETVEYSERMFLQGIAGTLELFHLSTVRFQALVGEATGHPVAVYQRIDQAGQRLPLDEQALSDTDT